jgi:hypothetical protein
MRRKWLLMDARSSLLQIHFPFPVFRFRNVLSKMIRSGPPLSSFLAAEDEEEHWQLDTLGLASRGSLLFGLLSAGYRRLIRSPAS